MVIQPKRLGLKETELQPILPLIFGRFQQLRLDVAHYAPLHEQLARRVHVVDVHVVDAFDLSRRLEQHTLDAVPGHFRSAAIACQRTEEKRAVKL